MVRDYMMKKLKDLAIQPSIILLKDGRLAALARTRSEHIGITYSEDNGKTWSKLKLIDTPNNNSGLDAVTLSDGNHVLICNDKPIPNGINPAWAGAFSNLKKNILDILFPNAEYITEEQWINAKNIFNPYIAWMGAKKGTQVEGLGYDTAKKILEENRKAELLELLLYTFLIEHISRT